MDIRLGLIFNGGGFTGAYSPGYTKAMRAFNLSSLYCQGVSVGALSGAGYVEQNGDPQKLEAVWRRIEREGPHAVFSPGDIPLRVFSGSLFGSKGIARLADTVDYNALVNAEPRFDVVTYNETLDRQEIFSNHEERCRENPSVLRDAVVASCALSGFLKPVAIGEHVYSDGLAFLIKPAILAGCNTIFVFLNDAPGGQNGDSERWWVARLLAGIRRMNGLIEAKELAAAQDANTDLRAFGEVVRALDTLGRVKRLFLGKTLRGLRFTFEGKHPVDIVIFRPREPIPSLWTLGYKKGDISRAIDHGYEVGASIIEEFLSSRRELLGEDEAAAVPTLNSLFKERDAPSESAEGTDDFLKLLRSRGAI